jgi:large subunit ribosomal protein L2
MEIKSQKPSTSSRRHLKQLSKTHLRKKPFIKKQIIGRTNSNGRNNSGRITVSHKGAGHKKRYRKINFNRVEESIGIVTSIEYDPNRNSNIASIYDFLSKNFFYIIAPNNLQLGDIVQSGLNMEAKLGNSLPLFKIPIGSFIHNIALKASKPAKLSRAAGAFSILKENSLNYTTIELSSGEQKFVSTQGYATIGVVSNELIMFAQKGKAGRARWLNNRPTVRGVAMNPVDHPHGGGEGKKSGKGVTPWGKPVKKASTKKRSQKKTISFSQIKNIQVDETS